MRAKSFILTVLLVPALLLGGCSWKKASVEQIAGDEVLFNQGVAHYQRVRFEDAEKAFKELMENYPLSPYSLKAQLMLGDTYYAMEHYEDAASYYASFVALHPVHPKATYAMFQKGMSHFMRILTLDRDQTSTRKALFAFEDLVEGYPESAYVDKAAELTKFLKERLAQSEFYVGRFYFKDKNYKGALSRFKEVIEKYPNAGLSAKSLFWIGKSYVKLGEAELARKVFVTLANEFPSSPFANKADNELQKVEG